MTGVFLPQISQGNMPKTINRLGRFLLTTQAIHSPSVSKRGAGDIIRFAGNNDELSDYDVRYLANYEYFDHSDYLKRVSMLKGKALKKYVIKTARRAKKAHRAAYFADDLFPVFFISLPAYLKGVVDGKRAYSNLIRIPDARIREAFIHSFIEERNNMTLVQAGYKAIPYISNSKTRDELIEQACTHNRSSIRKIGASLLPHVSDGALKKKLIQLLELDSNLGVSVRAKMMKKPNSLANKLFGWLAFRGIPPAKTDAIQFDDDDFTVENTGTLDAKNPGLGQKIDDLAKHMAERLKSYFQEDAVVRQALLAKYGDEKQLPTAGDIKKQFYEAAKGYLKKQNGPLSWWFGSSSTKEQVLELTHMLMNIADKTEAFLNLGDIPKQLSLLGEMEAQQKRTEAALEQAKAMVAQQALFRARAIKEHRQQEIKVSQLEVALEAARKEQHESQQAQLDLQLKAERQQLKEAEERKKVFDVAFQTAQSKVDALNAHIEACQKKWIHAMQYGMLGISRDELQNLVDKNEVNLEMLDVKGILDKAESKKYEVLAEQEATRQYLKDTKVAAFEVEDQSDKAKQKISQEAQGKLVQEVAR